MRISGIICLFIVTAFFPAGAMPPEPGEVPYRLVFSDEFNTDGKPAAHWGYEMGYVREGEAQYYTDDIENAYVGDGCLHIVGRKDHLGRQYTSASLNTRGSFAFMYGRFEVRARIPVSGGSWPAIWMMGNDYRWPECGEVDVMEYYSGYILANACRGGEKERHAVWNDSRTKLTRFTDPDPEWADKFHTWAMEWDEDKMEISLDGEILNTISLGETFNGGWEGNSENPFMAHKPGFGQFILLNLALGGYNGGKIDDSDFPREYLVDYVRVYQRERLP